MSGEPGSLLRLFADAAEVESRIVDGSETITISLAAGATYSITATAEDQAGNESAPSPALVVEVDQQPPPVPIFGLHPDSDLPPLGDELTELDRVVLVGQSEPLTRLTLLRNTVPPITLASAVADSSGAFEFLDVALANGDNPLLVIASDAAGNTSQASRTINSIAPDTSPPVISVWLRNDTGSSSVDQLTSDATVTGRVMDASAISTLEATVDGGVFANVLSSLVQGEFELTATQLDAIAGDALTDGQHVVQLRAVDEHGHTGSASLTFELDTLRPQPPGALNLASADDTGVDSGDNITRATTLHVATTAPADGLLRWYVEGDVVLEGAVTAGQTQLVVPAASDGEHRITATMVDEAGNESVFAPLLTVTVDTQEPLTPEFSLDSASVAMEFGTDHTTDQRIGVVGTTSPDTRVALQPGDHEARSDAAGVFSIDDVTLDVGANVVTVTATDVAGNEATVSRTVTFHDVTGPVIELGLVNDTGRLDSDLITSDPSVEAEIADASAIASLDLSVSGSAFVDVRDEVVAGVLTIDETLLSTVFGRPMPDGQHALMLRGSDVLGNVGEVATLQFTLDREAPPVPVPDLLPFADTGLFNWDNITSEVRPTVRLTSFPGDRVRLFEDGVEVASEETAGRSDFILGTFDDGEFTLTATAEDWAGNVSSSSDPVALVIDTTPPAVPRLELDEATGFDQPGGATTTRDRVNVSGITEPFALVELVETSQTTTADDEGNFELTWIPLELGEQTLTVTVTDRAGNLSGTSEIIIREEARPPAITVGLANDTAAGGGTNSDRITSDPTVVGNVTVDGGELVSFQVGLGIGVVESETNALGDLQNGQFTFDQARLEEIHGAPLENAPYRLRLIAEDDRGHVTDLDFFFALDTSPPTSLTPDVSYDSATGLYQYRYTLGNPVENAGDGDPDTFHRILFQVPSTIDILNFVTPAGWSVAYEDNDTQVAWSADGADAEMLPGESLVFGFDCSVPEGEQYFVVFRDAPSAGSNVSFGPTIGPVAPAVTASEAAEPEAITEREAITEQLDSRSVCFTCGGDAPSGMPTEEAWDPFGGHPFGEQSEGEGSDSSDDGDGGGGVTTQDGDVMYRVVATTQSRFSNLGSGVSVNNLGNVAYVGTDGGDNIYVSKPYRPSVHLMNRFFEKDNAGNILDQTFGEQVQLVDANVAVAWRYLLADVFYGLWMPWPVGDYHEYPLTYIEQYFLEPRIGIARQVVMGDGGMGMIPVLPFGAGAFLPYYPTASFVNPIWGNILLSPYYSTDEITAVYPYASMNNLGESAFGVWFGPEHDGGHGLVTGYHGEFQYRGGGGLGDVGLIGEYSGDFHASYAPNISRPMIDDTGHVVLRNGDQDTAPVLVVKSDMSTVQHITGSGVMDQGNGQNPGISDDGRVVVFRGMETRGCIPSEGNHCDPTDDVDDSPVESPVLFMAVKDETTGRFGPALRIAGKAGDGVVDPYEKWVDFNQNGEVEVGEDAFGLFNDFPDSVADERVGVNRLDTAELDNVYRVTFLAESTSGEVGLHALDFFIPPPNDPAEPAQVEFMLHHPYVSVGDTVAGAGVIKSISLHDPIGGMGDVAFWAQTSLGEAVIVAHPYKGDVIVERFGGAPSNDALDLVEVDYEIKLVEEDVLNKPLYFGFYVSRDGVLDDGDEFVGKFELKPEQIGEQYAVTALKDWDGNTVEKEYAKHAGRHRIQINPAMLQDQFLRKALEDRDNEILFVMADPEEPEEHIDYRYDRPDNNDAYFVGLYQHEPGSRGVARTGPDSEDTVSIDPEDTVAYQRGSDPWESRTFEKPADILVVTAQRDDQIYPTDFVEVKTPLVLMAGDGADFVVGGYGKDYLHAGLDEQADRYTVNVLIGNHGDDVLEGNTTSEATNVMLGDGYQSGPVQEFTSSLGSLSFTSQEALTPLGKGDDILNGGGGIDVMLGGRGSDTLNGGGGEFGIYIGDALRVARGPAVDFGTIWNSPNLTAWERAEDLLAEFGKLFDWVHFDFVGDGGDTINSKESLSISFGGNDNDTITNEKGVAVVFGGEGNDIINGKKGDHLLAFGGNGDDTITGSSPPAGAPAWSLTGSDILVGGDGWDKIFAGGGFVDISVGDSLSLGWPQFGKFTFDLLKGKFGTEWSVGMNGTGNDKIFGQDGFDIIIGGDGNDYLNGGNHGSLIFGDELALKPFQMADTFEEWFGSSQTQAGSTPAAEDQQAGTGGKVWNIFQTIIGLFDLTGHGDDEIVGTPGIDVIFGGAGNDDIRTGGGVFDIAFGNKHNDTLDGTQTRFNFLVGGDGDDTLMGSRLPVDAGSWLNTHHVTAGILLGDSFEFGGFQPGVGFEFSGGTFKLAGGISGLKLSGKGNDTIHAYNGYHLMVGGEGDDTLHGNGLVNIMIGDAFNIAAELSLEFNVKEALRQIWHGGGVAPSIMGNTGLVPTWPGLVGSGKNTILAGEEGARPGKPILNVAVGGAGDDTMTLNASLANVAFGNHGNDTINTGTSSGFSLILGGWGDDTLIGSESGSNVVFGDDVTLTGFDLEALKNGVLTANTPLSLVGTGDDTIRGGNGFLDILVGGDGDDTIEGQHGTINFMLGDGFNMPAGASVDLSLIRQYIWDPSRLFEILEQQFERQGVGHDTITGGEAWDIVIAGAGHDGIRTGGSWDVIFGNDGHDMMCAGTGDDRLVGGDGDDCLDGQEGVDVQLGGDGRDGFEFSSETEKTAEYTDYNPEEGDHVGCRRDLPLTLNKTEINENDFVTLSGGFAQDCNRTRLIKIDWGDGKSDIVAAYAFEIDHTYEDDRPVGEEDIYTIRVTDKQTGDSLGTKVVKVNNVAPYFSYIEPLSTFSAVPVVIERDIIEPSPKDALTLKIDWGDSHQEEKSYPAGTKKFKITHQYGSWGNYSIKLTLTDDDQGSHTQTVPLLLLPSPVGEAESEGGRMLASSEGESSDDAPTTPGGEFSVNTSHAGDQLLAEVAAAPDGRFVVVWDSIDQDGDGHGVVAQPYSAAGQPLGGEILVNSTSAGDQIFPDVAIAANGGFVVVWEGEDEDGRGIFARLFDPSGVPVGSEFPVNVTTTADQLRPRVAADRDGNFVVVWESLDQDGDGVGVVGRKFAANGTARGSEFVVNSTVDGNQWFPEIDMTDDGRFVVVWESASEADWGRDIRARQFTSQLAGGAEIVVGEQREGDQSFPAVAIDASGGFVVAWDSEMSPEHQLFAQQYAADGDPAGSQFSVTNTLARRAYSPSVSANPVGDFVVVWDVFGKDGYQQGSFGQRFDSDGTPQGGEFQINTTTAGDQSFPDVAVDSNGGFVAVWNSEDQDGEGLGVFGQRFGLVSTAGTISGYVYVDVNNNGVKDPPETPLPNVPITVSGPVTRTTVTDEQGLYTFTDLPPGTYTVHETQPSAFVDGIESVGQPPVGDASDNQIAGVQLDKQMDATVFNFGERGLRAELISKRFFLASPPSSPGVIEQLALTGTNGWFILDSNLDGELVIHLDPDIGDPVIEVYDHGMIPVAMSHGSTQLVVEVDEGHRYHLHIDGDNLDVAQLQVWPGQPVVHTNPVLYCDVSGDGNVSPIDALLVIRELNESAAHPLNGLSGGPPYLDVSDDGFISPIDALLVIGFLNSAVVDGEGESSESLTADAPEGESPDAAPLYSQHVAYPDYRLSYPEEEFEDSEASTTASPMPETVSDRLDLPSEKDCERDDVFAGWDSESNESDWDDLLTEVAEDVAVELGETDRVWRER